MSRSARESSCWPVLGWLMQAPPRQATVNAATGTLTGPVSVALAGVAKSACSRQTLSELEPKLTIGFGVPTAGSATPSRSEGSTPPKELESWKHSWVAGRPLIIALRSQAHSL